MSHLLCQLACVQIDFLDCFLFKSTRCSLEIEVCHILEIFRSWLQQQSPESLLLVSLMCSLTQVWSFSNRRNDPVKVRVYCPDHCYLLLQCK